MLQATCSEGCPVPDEDQLTQLVTAIYDVASHARRLQSQDPVDSARVGLLYHVRLLGSARPSDLASISRLDLSTVSRHLKELESVGCVERTVDPLDGRAFRVAITDKGEGILSIAIANRVDALRDVLARWTAQDRAEIGDLMRRLADDLASEYCAAPAPNLHAADTIEATA